MGEAFQVDLRGVVDLLSNHLYSSPQVFVRELLQNAVDAITARRDPSAPRRVTIETSDFTEDGTLRVSDTGVGLTEAQVQELLATIGRSSKRDELGQARAEFLGQFGIGLLSCFMVADEIRVETRCGTAPTVHWTGYADGHWTGFADGHWIGSADATAVGAVSGPERPETGTTVTLVPRGDGPSWFSRTAVADLASLYGAELPMEVMVDGAVITGEPAPWERGPMESAGRRRARLQSYCRKVFGFVPFDTVELSVPEIRLSGIAFVLPEPTTRTEQTGHRLYLKRMLLAENMLGLLPDWAFFVRCVADNAGLRPTASREALVEDAALESAREVLGERLRDWMVELAERQPDRLVVFLRAHYPAIMLPALAHDAILRIIERWWPMETNVGPMSLAEFGGRYGALRFMTDSRQFKQVAEIAEAAGLPLINAGNGYDAQLIARLREVDPSVVIEELTSADLVAYLEPLESAEELSLRAFLVTAERALSGYECEVLIRSFEPQCLPALYLPDADSAFRTALHETRGQVSKTWAEILGTFVPRTHSRAQLILNRRNDVVAQVITMNDDELTVLVVRALYVQALLLGHHPVRGAESSLLSESFLGLLRRVTLRGEAS
jgi:molecular chaperone HtpG